MLNCFLIVFLLCWIFTDFQRVYLSIEAKTHRVEGVVCLYRDVPAFRISSDTLNEDGYGRDEATQALANQVGVQVGVPGIQGRKSLISIKCDKSAVVFLLQKQLVAWLS